MVSVEERCPSTEVSLQFPPCRRRPISGLARAGAELTEVRHPGGFTKRRGGRHRGKARGPNDCTSERRGVRLGSARGPREFVRCSRKQDLASLGVAAHGRKGNRWGFEGAGGVHVCACTTTLLQHDVPDERRNKLHRRGFLVNGGAALLSRGGARSWGRGSERLSGAEATLES